MLVSIVIPIYNAERFIEKCATTLFEQTYRDIEYIFVDDACTDRSMERLQKVIEQYPHRQEQIKVISHKRNRGSAMARNTGLKEAIGEYIIQVDSDDYVSPDFIEKLVDGTGNGEYDVVICSFYYIHKKGKTVKAKISKMCQSQEQCLSHLLSGALHNGLWNKLIRRSIFTDHRINFVKGVDMYDDKSVMYRVLFFTPKINYIDEFLYYYNKTNPNSITSQSKINSIKPALKLCDMMDDFFSRYVDEKLTDYINKGLDYFKVSVMGLVLLYDNEGNIARNMLNFMYQQWKVKTIINQPMIPYYYKLAVLCYKGHFYVGVRILRGFLRTFKSFK